VPTALSRSSWLAQIVTGLTAASGVGYLATAYTVSRWLTRTTRARQTLPATAEGMTWEEVSCTTEDGLRLAGWVVAPPRPRATIALFHGLRGSKTKLLERIDLLAAAGYRCVAFDHRAHGQSQGRRTSFGYYESRDARAVLQLIARRWSHQPRAALGISMGAAALCFVPQEVNSLDAVILESLYGDLASAFRSRVGRGYPPWVSRFSRGVIWVTERRLGLRLVDLNPIEQVRRLAPAPVLLLTGSDDPHAPAAEVFRIYKRCHEPREFAVIPGASHGNVCEVGGEYYRELILDFLERRLGA
jgi:alpha-beta hydrolase superfamily lysophospholipase